MVQNILQHHEKELIEGLEIPSTTLFPLKYAGGAGVYRHQQEISYIIPQQHNRKGTDQLNYMEAN